MVMGAGWLYYHKYPPRRKCSTCGKRHYAKRIATASNGEDFWRVVCTRRNDGVSGQHPKRSAKLSRKLTEKEIKRIVNNRPRDKRGTP